MKKYLVILLSILIFSSSVLDTSKLKDNFFSSIENFLDGNFKDTDFSIKSTEGIQSLKLGIETFQTIKLRTENGSNVFPRIIYLLMTVTRETINLGFGKRIFSDDEISIYVRFKCIL